MDCLISNEQNGILILRLNRPEKHNSLNGDLLQALEEAINHAKQKASIRALLLIGNGKSFCAGADINRLAECNAQSGYEFAKMGQAVFASLEQLGKPSLAALHGHALGGGCELAMSAHLRMAHHETFLGQPEVKLGVIPGYGGTQRLSRLVGRARAIGLCVSGRFVDAHTANQWGLVNWVVEQDLEVQALDYLNQLTQLPPIAIQGILDSILVGNDMGLAQALDYEAIQFAKACASEDKKEGVEAFLQKRKPIFRGC
jgi:enoyl-CoA hydratase